MIPWPKIRMKLIDSAAEGVTSRSKKRRAVHVQQLGEESFEAIESYHSVLLFHKSFAF